MRYATARSVWLRSAIVTAAVAATVTTLPVQAAQAGRSAAQLATVCYDYFLIGSRGSGQDPSADNGLGKEIDQFRVRFAADLSSTGKTFGFEANPYPAVAVAGGSASATDGWMGNAIGAGFGLAVGKYHQSVAAGVTWLTSNNGVFGGGSSGTGEIQSYLSKCPNSKILLAGFSQGAQVSGNAYSALPASVQASVVGVFLLADPRRNGSDLVVNRGSSGTRGNGAVKELNTTNPRPPFPASDYGKVLSYCRSGDPVCAGYFGFSTSGLIWNLPNLALGFHTTYDQFIGSCGVTYPVEAADYFANKVAGNSSTGPVAVLAPANDALAGEPVTISAAGSCDPAGQGLTYSWTVDGAAASGTGDELTTTFASAGSHTVSVTVTDTQNLTATATETVTVAAPGSFTGVPGAPVNVTSTPAADGSGATLTWSPAASGPPSEAYKIYTTDGEPLVGVKPGDPLSLTFPESDLPLTVNVVAVNRVGDGPASAAVTMYADWPPIQPAPSSSCGALNSMFDNYGNQGGHWTGGDTTMSVPLPDGRTAWFFSDTYLGTVNADGSRPANSPLIHNSIVVQNGSTLTTITGGTAQSPAPVVANPSSGGWYWVGDGMVNGSTLQVFYHNYKSNGSGPLAFSYVGTAVATFALPSLALQSVVTLPTTTQIDWGAALMDGGDGYDYIYGTEGGANGGTSYLHIARAPYGSLADMSKWQFWSNNPAFGTNGWSSTETDAAPVLTGVGTGFSVKKLNGQFVLVTMDGDITFSPNILGYFSAKPYGPFAHQQLFYKAPEANGSTIVYDARVHPEQSCGTGFVVSYNVNSLTPGADLADVSIYRPRFITVNLPGPVTGLPDPPTNLQASVAPGTSTVTLTWTAPTGPNDTNLSYRVYQRDLSTQQTQYSPLPNTVTTTTDSVILADAGTYAYRVAAINSAGEGPPSEMTEVDVTVPPPTAAPTNLAATANPDGTVGLTWTPVTGMAGWVSYQLRGQDLTAGTAWDTPVTTFQNSVSATVSAQWLTMGHTYQFEVQAVNSGGAGPWSGPVSVVPAVTGVNNLSATAQPDGSVALSWSAPLNGDWYWIYTCDTTAPPTGGCKSPNPGNDGYTRSVYPLATGPGFTETGLTGGHTYNFYVTAVSTQGATSGPSNVATATVALPVAPTLSATANNNASVSLSWTAPPAGYPTYWYWIYSCDTTHPPSGGCLAPNPGHDNYTQSVYPDTLRSFTATLLHAGDTYSYYVTSIGPGSAQSVPSNVKTVTAYIAAPSNLTATPGDGQVMLNWKPGLAGQWYWVYENGSSTPLTYPATHPWATIGGLTNGTTYTFSVTTIAPGGGESAHSNTVSVTPRATPPNAPTGLTATSQSDGSIYLKWNQVATGDWYWIYYCDLDGTNCGQPNPGHDGYTKLADPDTTTTFTHTGLVNGDRYIYYVQTIGTNGALSAPSDTAQAVSVIAPPTNLTATANKDGTVTLNWSAPPPSGTSKYYWIYTNGTRSVDPLYTSNQSVSFKVIGLTTGASYQFCVTAAGYGDSESNCSNTVTITAVLAPPTGVKASVDGYGNVTISWTEPFTGKGELYWLYYCDTTNPPSGGCLAPNPGHDNYTRTGPASSASASGLLVTDFSLKSDDTYSFYVTTAYAGQESKASNAVAPSRQLAAPTGLTGWTKIVTSGYGASQCEAFLGPDCRIHLQWNAVTGADHYDIYQLNDSADQPNFYYIGSAYSNSIDLHLGVLAQNLVTYYVRAVRAYGGGTSPDSNFKTLTVGDYGRNYTDCYLQTTSPYYSGGKMHYDAQDICPRSIPLLEVIDTLSVIDNNMQTNDQRNLCWTTNNCFQSVTTNLLSGTHSYCTYGEMHIDPSLDAGKLETLFTGVISDCIPISG